MKNSLRDALLQIWSEVLQYANIGDDDNFFACGGNSIKAILITRRVQNELGRDVEFIDILRYPTVRKLDLLLSDRLTAADAAVIRPAPLRHSYPLSAVQREFYLLDSLTRQRDAAVSCTVMSFSTALDQQQSAAAFRRLLDRHETLRTTFSFERGAPVQTIRQTDDLPSGFAYSDLSGYDSPEERAQQIYEQNSTQPFDLDTGPLVRIHICVISQHRSLGFLSVHHIAADGFSAAILEQQFRQFYDGNDDEFLAQPLSFHYKDFSHWLNGWLDSHAARHALNYWRSTFSSYRKPALFSNQLATPTVPSFAAARVSALLGSQAAIDIAQLGVEENTTLFVLLQSSIKIFLYRESGVEDIVIGSPITLRDTVDLSGQVGPYLNTLPIRTRVDRKKSLREFVRDVHEATLMAYAYKLLPFASIATEAGLTSKLFDVGFTLQNQTAARQDSAPELRQAPEHSEGLTVKLWIVASERPYGIELNLHYQKSAFAREVVAGMATRLVSVISTAARSPDRPIENLFPELRPAFAQNVGLDFS